MFQAQLLNSSSFLYKHIPSLLCYIITHLSIRQLSNLARDLSIIIKNDIIQNNNKHYTYEL